MNLTDLIIIYLACGSPFAVYQITNRQPAISATGWAVVGTAFLLWPAFVLSNADKQIFRGPKKSEASRHRQIEKIRFELERLIFSDSATASLFEFRDIFLRFTSLVEAARVETPDTSAYDLFEISGHHNKVLASRCLTRRNREKLVFHQTLVRNEFVDLISHFAGIASERNEILRLAVELSDRLGDGAATEEFAALLSRQTRPAPAKSYAVAEEAVISKAHSASTVR
jgi:hypothetical protein